ncbi:MFS transporter [Bradyrhizobium hereditatis]|uniref:MFS transporter n=1 Tax=Bradyrhizobium hereditatis TaxID=2821405 RepID=UPI004063C80D
MLPPGRTAATPTFGTSRIRSARRREKSKAGAPTEPAVSSNVEPKPAEASLGSRSPLQKWRLIACVFFLFVAGYYLSDLFRTITSSVSGQLISEFGLDAADIGLLASVYFLFFAAAQIPIGVLLDRFGPRRVQARSWS